MRLVPFFSVFHRSNRGFPAPPFVRSFREIAPSDKLDIEDGGGGGKSAIVEHTQLSKLIDAHHSLTFSLMPQLNPQLK